MELLIVVKEVVLIGFLFSAAWMDYRKKELPLVFIIAGAGIGIILQILSREFSIWNIIIGCLIGVLYLVIGKLTKEAVGYGDGFMLIASGTFLGFQNNVLLLLCGLFLASAFSIGALIFRKMKRKDELPFMPFLFGGYVLLLMF